VPRHVDLHAMKRIGIVHWEFLAEGLPCALHVNGRAETDFRRWGAYIRARPEVTQIAATGTGRAPRRPFHTQWLINVGIAAGRPLDLIVRGGIEVLPSLAAAFNRVSVLETWSFMKTMNRQRLVLGDGGRLRSRPSPTAPGAPLDVLHGGNRAAVRN
jgi:hypothetical protein